MNYFNKNKVIFWILVAVIIINFSATATILYKIYFNPSIETPTPPAFTPPKTFFEEELNFSPQQAAEFRKLKEIHVDSLQYFKMLMREKRNEIFNNLSSGKIDTAEVYATADELGVLYSKIRKLNIRHYFDIYKICDTAQQKKLTHFYRNIFCFGDECNVEGRKHKCFGKHHPNPNHNRRCN